MGLFLSSVHLQLALWKICGLPKWLSAFLACPQGQRHAPSILTQQMRSVVMRELCGPPVYDIAEPGTRLIFLMRKDEPHYYPSSLINGRTRFTCPWCGEFMNRNLIFLFKTQATSPFLKSREAVSVLQQIFLKWIGLRAVFR